MPIDDDDSYSEAIIKTIKDFSADFATHRITVDNQLNVWNVAVRNDLNRAVASLNAHIASLDRTSDSDGKLRIERQKLLDVRLDNIDRHMKYLFGVVTVLIVLCIIFIGLMLYLILR